MVRTERSGQLLYIERLLIYRTKSGGSAAAVPMINASRRLSAPSHASKKIPEIPEMAEYFSTHSGALIRPFRWPGTLPGSTNPVLRHDRARIGLHQTPPREKT